MLKNGHRVFAMLLWAMSTDEHVYGFFGKVFYCKVYILYSIITTYIK